VALMCLAEALLRIPDAATRDSLIRDKLSSADWHSHVGQSPSMFVNAATWGLVLTGRLVGTSSEQSLSAALTRLISRSGESIIRHGVDLAIWRAGSQAWSRTSRLVSRTFRTLFAHITVVGISPAVDGSPLSTRSARYRQP
jgi:proline dehydrogenase